MSNSLDSLNSWYSEWTGLRVAVFGLGKTGFSVADTLTELGADVLVLADHADEDHTKLVQVIGAQLYTGALDAAPQQLVDFDPELVITSPGFRPDHALIRWAQDRGTAIWGDVELAWRVRDKVNTAEWILVTGTNGKTTTTQLTATMLAAGGARVAPCGNIGVPVLDAVRDPAGFDYFVVELSSFQLHYLSAGRDHSILEPLSAVCLNIADDHIDWHGSLEAYAAAKAHVYDGVGVACVYNKADERTMRMVEEADVREGARAIGFDLGMPGPSDFGIVEGIVVDRAFHEDRRNAALELTTVADLARVGLGAPHLVADVLAAAALARSAGTSPEQISVALGDFTLDAHRVQRIAEADGVTWIDDSKATNAHAAQASLLAFDPVVWIVGGLLKGAHLDGLVGLGASRLRGVVLIGADRDELRGVFARHAPNVPVTEVVTDDTGDVMRIAVAAAAEYAQAGDTVLLAPAAASMDQFSDYAQRGFAFADAVRTRLEGNTHDLDPERPRGE